jgi:hypothetical protein
MENIPPQPPHDEEMADKEFNSRPAPPCHTRTSMLSPFDHIELQKLRENFARDAYDHRRSLAQPSFSTIRAQTALLCRLIKDIVKTSNSDKLAFVFCYRCNSLMITPQSLADFHHASYVISGRCAVEKFLSTENDYIGKIDLHISLAYLYSDQKTISLNYRDVMFCAGSPVAHSDEAPAQIEHAFRAQPNLFQLMVRKVVFYNIDKFNPPE